MVVLSKTVDIRRVGQNGGDLQELILEHKTTNGRVEQDTIGGASSHFKLKHAIACPILPTEHQVGHERARVAHIVELERNFETRASRVVDFDTQDLLIHIVGFESEIVDGIAKRRLMSRESSQRDAHFATNRARVRGRVAVVVLGKKAPRHVRSSRRAPNTIAFRAFLIDRCAERVRCFGKAIDALRLEIGVRKARN